MVYVWLGLIVAFIAVEAATVNLVSIWFIGGAVAGLVCAILATVQSFSVIRRMARSCEVSSSSRRSARACRSERPLTRSATRT